MVGMGMVVVGKKGTLRMGIDSWGRVRLDIVYVDRIVLHSLSLSFFHFF
jgi:hypothetical protein